MLDILPVGSLSGCERLGKAHGAKISPQLHYAIKKGLKSMFSGSIPALVTPFRGGQFDEGAFRRLVDWQIEQVVQNEKSARQVFAVRPFDTFAANNAGQANYPR